MEGRMKGKGFKLVVNVLLGCALVLIGYSCGTASDPEPINEEELITTVNVTFTNSVNPNDIVLASFQDLDGPGGNDGIVMNPVLSSHTVYNVEVEFLNESVFPTGNITVEVEAEGDDHQVFYITSSNLQFNLTYSDQDINGYPVGINSTVDVGASGTGTMEVILVHLPNKNNAGVSEGNIANAGGDEDIHISFDVTIQ